MRRRHLLVMGALLILLAVAVAANVAQRRAPIGVSLAAIVNNQGQWTGRAVRVTGRVAEFASPGGSPYAVIQDTHENRIGLRGSASWRGLVGRQVVAVGTVAFDPHFGLYLAGARLTPLAPPATATPAPVHH